VPQSNPIAAPRYAGYARGVSAKSYRAVLERIEELAPETRALFLGLPAGRGLQFQAGQFLSLQLPIGGERFVRAYSVASDPAAEERLEIALDRVEGGPGSTHLFSLAPGAEIELTGPWGSFVLGTPPPSRCVFVAQGTGVAPLRPMVHAALAAGEVTELHLLHAVPAETALLYRADFEACARADRRFRYEPFLEPAGDAGHQRLADLVQRRWIEQEKDRSRHFFVCGVGDIVPRLRDLLRGGGYERRAVRYEKW